MNVEDRKKLVAKLLSATKLRAMEEVKVILGEGQPSRGFLQEHVRKYVLAKYMLSPESEGDSIRELARLSLAATMKLDKNAIHDLDTATPCDHATSESTKKVLLLYAIQKDLELIPNPEKISKIESVTALADYVYEALKLK